MRRDFVRNVYVLSKRDWSSVSSVQVRNFTSLESGVNLARALFMLEDVVDVDNIYDVLLNV